MIPEPTWPRVYRFRDFLRKEMPKCVTETERETVRDFLRWISVEPHTGPEAPPEQRPAKTAPAQPPREGKRTYGRHTPEFRAEVVRRLADPDGPTQVELSAELGIPAITIGGWWRKAVKEKKIQGKPWGWWRNRG